MGPLHHQIGTGRLVVSGGDHTPGARADPAAEGELLVVLEEFEWLQVDSSEMHQRLRAFPEARGAEQPTRHGFVEGAFEAVDSGMPSDPGEDCRDARHAAIVTRERLLVKCARELDRFGMRARLDREGDGAGHLTPAIGRIRPVAAAFGRRLEILDHGEHLASVPSFDVLPSPVE